MTTTDSAFIAKGPAAVGFYVQALPRRPSGFTFGALGVGKGAGVYGMNDDWLGQPSAVTLFGNAGVLGSSTASPGVGGFSYGAEGVFGMTAHSSGVHGYSSNFAGVSGVSTNGAGMSGWSPNHYGVFGSSDSTSGVVGQSGPFLASNPNVTTTTAGVVGIAGDQGPQLAQAAQVGKNIMPSTAGVFGTADQHPGVIGASNAGIGVYGLSTGNAGVVGETTNPMAPAGYFAGNVVVTGQIFAGIKDAIVPFPDGSKRVLHCMESPEHWFEDFGAGKLKRGRAVVKLDADFAKVIKRGDYHVFLTPRADCGGLYVRSQGGPSFEVRELADGRSSVAFSYRIVGRRKDIKGHRRFTKIDTHFPLPVARGRPARLAQRMKTPGPTPAELRAFAARMEKEARAQMRKRSHKGKGS